MADSLATEGRDSEQRRVLIIDRDQASVRSLQSVLESAGFAVTVHDGALGVPAIQRESPHLIVLNWGLPEVSIRGLLRQVRRVGPDERPNLLAVSDSAGEELVLNGFELGVDDFVAKPYSEQEIVARVRAILRARSPRTVKTNALRFHKLQLHSQDNVLTAGGEPVQLRALELRLLRFLLQHPDRAFTREQLLIRIWGIEHRSDSRVVDVTIQRTRKALLPHGCDEYLQAVRGVGYRLSQPTSSGPKTRSLSD
jgi:two-component system phosphate regulon response regulator PhoB